MSDREWRFYLDDMLTFAEKVVLYTDGLDQSAFEENGLNYDASVRKLELTGEPPPIYRRRFVSRTPPYPGVR